MTWLSACGREDLVDKIDNLKSYRLCATHFERKMFVGNLDNKLIKNAIPTIFPAMEGSTFMESVEQKPHAIKRVSDTSSSSKCGL